MSSASTLFTPVQVGKSELLHRVVLAPLTRYRANREHVHGDLAVEYYRQRSSTPGTLLITEATFIAPQAAGYKNAPGIWSKDQIQAWKRVTDAVHANQSFIYVQLWALGRAANPGVLEEEGGYPYVSASNVPMLSRPGQNATPRALTKEEIHEYVALYAQAAENAIEAGFDGVEIHAANGYLIDQFIQNVSNTRTDEYGGPVENRTRFALEIVSAIANAIGEDRTAIRLSPWSQYQDMREKDPVTTFTYLIEQLATRHSNLAYLHMIEPGVFTNANDADDSNDFAREIWQPRPYIAAGGFTPETARSTVEAQGGLIAFGQSFLANPDLPKRIRDGLELTPANPDTFFAAETATGYTDYPFASESTPQRL